MEESQLKSFVAIQLADKLHEDINSLDVHTITMIVQKHKEKVVDFFNQRMEVNEEIKKAFIRQKSFETELNDFLESSYKDFKKHPLSIDSSKPKKEELTIELNPIKENLDIDSEIAMGELIDEDAIPVMPSVSTPIAPTPQTIPTTTGNPSPIAQPLSNTSKQPQDMRFGSQNQPKPQPPPPMKKLYFMNGEEGKIYEYKIDWQKIGLTNVGKHRFVGLEKYGLTYNEDMEFISGTPNATGELAFQFFYSTKDGFFSKNEIECQVLLFIKPDTRKMFDRQIEPEPNQPYPKAHLDKCLIQGKEKTLVGASRRGRSHAMDGRFRDDDMKMVYREEDGWYIIAVADGAGSAKYARQGSLIACETAVSVIQNSGKLAELHRFLTNIAPNTEGGKNSPELKTLMYSLLGQTALEAHKAISRESAATAGSADKDYSTTLLISIVKKYENQWFIGSYWVGDGGIGIYFDDDRAPIIMGTPDSGEFSGQTRFLTMRDIFADYETIAKRLWVEFVPDFKALVLMTDGVTDALFHTEANLLKKEIWDKFYTHLTNDVNLIHNNPSVSDELLEWLNFWEKGEYDDRTIAILY